MPTIQHENYSLYYERVGSGVPIVMHNGFGNSIRDFYELGYVEALSSDYQLVLLDGRGFGQSSKPHAVQEYSFQRRCSDTIAVMDALGIDQAIAWGYSMGGRMVYALMRYYPQRFSAYIAGGMHPYGDRTDLGKTLQGLLSQGMEHFVTQFEREIEPFPFNLRQRYLQNDPKALSAVLAAYCQPLMDFSSDLAKIEVPILLYSGSEDEVLEKTQAASGLIQQGGMRVADGMSHCQTFWQSTWACNQAITFLDEYTC